MKKITVILTSQYGMGSSTKASFAPFVDTRVYQTSPTDEDEDDDEESSATGYTYTYVYTFQKVRIYKEMTLWTNLHVLIANTKEKHLKILHMPNSNSLCTPIGASSHCRIMANIFKMYRRGGHITKDKPVCRLKEHMVGKVWAQSPQAQNLVASSSQLK